MTPEPGCRHLDGGVVPTNRQLVRFGVGFALLLTVLVADGAAAAADRGGRTESSTQALRTCVDRWNQGNMLSWRSQSVRISIRALTANERSRLSLPGHAQRRCTLSLADRPGENTWICRLLDSGAYDCPLVTSDGMPVLKGANTTTNKRGFLTLDAPLAGTHRTLPLAWQHYPHTDGFILPWTPAGTLRPGLSFVGHEGGRCGFFVEHVVPQSAGRCVLSNGAIYEPCFPQHRNFVVHASAACGYPGSRHFVRLFVTARL